MKFLVTGILKAHDYFIFDSYNDYIVTADSESGAMDQINALVSVLDGRIKQLIEIEEVKPISDSNAKAFMATNNTKKVNDFITQVIIY